MALFHPALLLIFEILPTCTFIPTCTIIQETKVSSNIGAQEIQTLDSDDSRQFLTSGDH